MDEIFYPTSNFASQGKDFSIAHGYDEPPDLDPTSVFHVVSS